MAAPTSNQFWKQRSKHGRDLIYKNPELLWEAAKEYFEWCDAHPWEVHTPVKAGDHFGETVTAPVSRPYTLTGLCVFLDIDEETLNNYGKREGFLGIISRIKRIAYTQKFEGACVGAFNANIIARDLGLKDAKEVEIKNEEKGIFKIGNQTIEF